MLKLMGRPQLAIHSQMKKLGFTAAIQLPNRVHFGDVLPVHICTRFWTIWYMFHLQFLWTQEVFEIPSLSGLVHGKSRNREPGPPVSGYWGAKKEHETWSCANILGMPSQTILHTSNTVGMLDPCRITAPANSGLGLLNDQLACRRGANASGGWASLIGWFGQVGYAPRRSKMGCKISCAFGISYIDWCLVILQTPPFF